MLADRKAATLIKSWLIDALMDREKLLINVPATIDALNHGCKYELDILPAVSWGQFLRSLKKLLREKIISLDISNFPIKDACMYYDEFLRISSAGELLLSNKIRWNYARIAKGPNFPKVTQPS